MKSRVEHLTKKLLSDPPTDRREGRARWQEIVEAIEKTDDENELIFIVDDLLWYDLPVELSDAIFEKYLELNDTNPRVLKWYAWHLRLHWPDCDDKADELWNRAEALEE